jgi:hypothetical protein
MADGQAASEAEAFVITPEMIEAGVERLADLPRDESPEWIVRWVYLAMAYERQRSRR